MAQELSVVPGLKSAAASLQSLGLEFAVADDLLKRNGVTRLVNLTGLDTIDVPVWSCVRPNSRSLAVSFGKGLTHGQAQASAMMEAMESAFAEDRQTLVNLFASVGELERQGINTVPLQALSRCRFHHVDREAQLGWVRGTSLKTREEVLAPFELIGLDYTKSALSAAFRMSTIGLGAGRTWQDAVCHAILELIEHDAVAILELIPALADALPAERYRPGFSERLDEALELFKPAGIEPIFRSVSSQIGIPVAMCSIPRLSAMGPDRTCAGFAARESLEDAALAALLEAAQVRMTIIAGARDDLKWSDYQQAGHFFDPAPALVPSADNSPLFGVAREKPPTKLTLQEILRRLGQAGIDNLYAFPLTRAGDPIHVVRVLAEGLDVADQDSGMNLGQSALSTLLKLSFAVQ
ncbi:YcaO-like family protein [Mesorhizobium sp. M0058]|uniref:YcaO-like family protein n=1 Tax=Mesorhizobium sp. M0058 TaxID=2956865 RepID=UPI003336FC43